MVNFKKNAGIVLSTLEKYRYGSRIVAISRKCIEDLSCVMECWEGRTFSTEHALEWCDSRVPKYLKQPYKLTICRLDDVYKYGRVLGNHITIHAQPSESFLLAINGYLDTLRLAGNYTAIHLKNIRHTVTRFCCFAQYNGTGDPDDIGYGLLDAYDSFLRESSKAFKINEGLVVGFLEHMSTVGKCPKGLSLYMHYIESDKISRLSDLSASTCGVIESAQKNCVGISAYEFYKTIDDFTAQLKGVSYSRTVTDSVPYHLILLFLFLDREGLRYDRTTVEAWFLEEGNRLFKTGVFMARRTYEMYDDYIREGTITPSHCWKHGENMFDKLPSWSAEWISAFLSAKEKEGWEKNTIKMYRVCVTSFCSFITSSGIGAFEELTPKLIKEYNAWDCGHKTPEAKNAYNSRVRKFLIFLEMNGIIPISMHHSLPHNAADSEVIVEVLSDEDMLAIEMYCKDAKTPLQLRDAAMLMILKETGLRSCDVAGLKITDIDWRQKSIRVVQKKTGVGHLHPMSTKTGNQIYRYIKDGRQKDTGCSELFLKRKAPYGPVGRYACRNAMERAGVSTGRTHLLRKSFASSTLKSGASIVETAEMLGHSDTRSVHKYTQLDTERMRLCPLSLSETGLLLEGRYRHG